MNKRLYLVHNFTGSSGGNPFHGLEAHVYLENRVPFLALTRRYWEFSNDVHFHGYLSFYGADELVCTWKSICAVK